MFSVTCSCGCEDGFVFRELDGSLFISSVSSDFYMLQTNSWNKFIKNLKEYIFLSHRKRFILKDICVKKEDIENLLDYLNSIYDKLNDDEVDNISKLIIVREDFKEYNYTDYSIELISRAKNAKEIFFKTHRKYDLVLNKKETKKLIKYCKKALQE